MEDILVKSIDDIDSESSMFAFISSRGRRFINMLQEIIKQLYNTEEEVRFCGTEYNISNGRHSYIRPDIMFVSSKRKIPVEMKMYASTSALSQIHKYMNRLDNPMGIIVCLTATKDLKSYVKEEDNVVLIVLEEGKLY